jgi:polyribonucleotide nucleotidyltransferase
MQIKEFSTEVGGKTITAQFTNLADQTNGSVIMRSGNTAVLVTAVMGRESDKGYFPLSVEYEEKFYAAGAILGGRFNKREGKPSDEAVLSARIVDRTIRPLFDQALRRDIQIIVTVLSIDTEDPDVLAVIGASLALGTSNIPWGGPVSAARIGRKNSTDAFIINPSYADRSHEAYTLDVLACGKDGLVNMIEVGANEVPEEELKTALYEATKVHAALQQWQESIIKEIGVEKLALQTPAVPETVQKLFAQHIEPKMNEYVFEKNAAYTLKDEWMTLAKEQLETDVEVKHLLIIRKRWSSGALLMRWASCSR